LIFPDVFGIGIRVPFQRRFEIGVTYRYVFGKSVTHQYGCVIGVQIKTTFLALS